MKIGKIVAAAAIAAMVLLSLAPPASAQARVIVRPYYRYYYPNYYGFWGPRWSYYPAPYYFVPEPVTGDVKIETHIKGDSIYVDGGYAGVTGKLKKFSLKPGNHDIEVRDVAGATIYKQRIQVLAGKTTEIKLAA